MKLENLQQAVLLENKLNHAENAVEDVKVIRDKVDANHNGKIGISILASERYQGIKIDEQIVKEFLDKLIISLEGDVDKIKKEIETFDMPKDTDAPNEDITEKIISLSRSYDCLEKVGRLQENNNIKYKDVYDYIRQNWNGIIIKYK